MLLEKIISSFIILTGTRHIVAGIDSTGFKVTHAYHNTILRDLIPEVYICQIIDRGAYVLQQIICNIKIRRAPTIHVIT
jgi:hypothetical protein